MAEFLFRIWDLDGHTRYFCLRFELEINLTLQKPVLANIPHFILLSSCHFEPLVLYKQHLITSNQSNICRERAYLKLTCWNIFKESALNNIDFKLKTKCQHFLKQKRKLKHIMKTTDEILLLLLSRKAISLNSKLMRKIQELQPALLRNLPWHFSTLWFFTLPISQLFLTGQFLYLTF